MEVMLTNVIQLATEATPALGARAELLEGFALLAKRPSIKYGGVRCMYRFRFRFRL